MKICIPIVENKGLESDVNGHFGSSRDFLIYNTDGKKFEIRTNKDADHQHGMCQPLKAIDGAAISVVIVGGLGAGALNKLNAAGIKVFGAIEGSVEQNINCFESGLLHELTPATACAGHGSCDHH